MDDPSSALIGCMPHDHWWEVSDTVPVAGDGSARSCFCFFYSSSHQTREGL